MLVVIRSLNNLRLNAGPIGELVRRLEVENEPLSGIWCDPDSQFLPEAAVAVRCAPGVYRSIRFEHAHELAGVWAVWRFEPLFGDEIVSRPSHRDLAGALLANDDGRPGRLYVPVYDSWAHPRKVAAEMDQLISAYPQRIGAPLYRHDRSSRLSWVPAVSGAA